MRKVLEDARPKEGHYVRFQVKNVHLDAKNRRQVPGRVAIPQRYVISDKKGKQNVRKTIEYIIGYEPMDDEGNIRPVYGEVAFTRDLNGYIHCYGSSPEDIDLFDFLYLSPYLEGNGGKKWFIKSKGGIKYTLQQPKKTASEKVASRVELSKAFLVLQEMGEKKLRRATRGFKVRGVNVNSTEDELINALYEQVAEKDPQRILNIDNDREFSTTAFIQEALDKDIITFESKSWVMSATGNPFYNILDGEDSKAVLAVFLESNAGKEDRESIQEQIEKSGT